jgi:4-hydroxy-tetrahydrodipicolinate synthase
LGLIRHFTAIADATDLPVILYNVPPRTGMDIKPETYLELSKHPNIVATKEANGNIASSVRTASLCGEDLALYSGEDALVIPLLSLGGKGVISVIANVAPAETHEMCQCFFDGEIAKAAALQLRLSNLADAMFCDVNPIPVKYALNLMGRKVGPCRLPLVDPAPAQATFIEAELKKQFIVHSS